MIFFWGWIIALIIAFAILAMIGLVMDIKFFKRQIDLSKELEDYLDTITPTTFVAKDFMTDLKNIGFESNDTVYSQVLNVKHLVRQGAPVAAADLTDHLLRERQTNKLSQSHQFAFAVLLISGIFGSLLNFSNIIPQTTDTSSNTHYQEMTAQLPTKINEAFWPAGTAIFCMVFLLLIRYFWWESLREKSLHTIVNTTNFVLIPFFTQAFLEEHPLTRIIEYALKKTTSTFSATVNDLNQATQSFTHTITVLNNTATTLNNATNRFDTATASFVTSIDKTMQLISKIAINFHTQTLEIRKLITQFDKTNQTLSAHNTELTQAIKSFTEVTKDDSPMVKALETLFDNLKIVDTQYQDVINQLVQANNLIGQEQTQHTDLQNKILDLVTITQQATKTNKNMIIKLEKRNLAVNTSLSDQLRTVITDDLSTPINKSMQDLHTQIQGLNTTIDLTKQELIHFTKSTHTQNIHLDQLTKGIPVTTDITISQDLQNELNKSQNSLLSLEQAIQKLTQDIPINLQNELNKYQGTLLLLKKTFQTLNTEINELRTSLKKNKPSKSWFGFGS